MWLACALSLPFEFSTRALLSVSSGRGQPIPRIEYTPEEVAVWGTALSKLKALFPSHACKEFNAALPKINFRCDGCGIPTKTSVHCAFHNRTWLFVT
jgi:phenylalanine-4-hydroxylase